MLGHPASTPPARMNAPPTLRENSPKAEIKLSSMCATPHENQSQSQIPPELLPPETPFRLQLAPDPFKLNFFDIFGNSKAFHNVST